MFLSLRTKVTALVVGLSALLTSTAGAQLPEPKPWIQPSGWGVAGVGYVNTTYDYENHVVFDYWGIRLDWVSRGVLDFWYGICQPSFYESGGYLHPTARIEFRAPIPYNFVCRIDGHQITRVNSQGVREFDGLLTWDADGWNAGGRPVHLLATNFDTYAQVAIGN